ncbi:ROK family protein [Streptomyces mirabilis]|uniref:ROK family protein n=1 Tax=Streptomyces mirabilis TaxID=68239 RepID=UPI0036A5693D
MDRPDLGGGAVPPVRSTCRRRQRRRHGGRGEHAFGAARSIDDFLYIKASHGIGAGLALAGRTYHGSSGIAGEIGHTRLEGATNLCRYGNRGCLEIVVSITDVRRQLAHILPAERPADPTPPGGPPSLADLVTRPAARVITDAGRTLGLVLADLVNCLNPADHPRWRTRRSRRAPGRRRTRVHQPIRPARQCQGGHHHRRHTSTTLRTPRRRGNRHPAIHRQLNDLQELPDPL